MKLSNKSMLSVPLLVVGSVALSGCGQKTATPTTITYHQVGVCKHYTDLNGTEQTTKPDEGFAVFKIASIDNTQNSAFFNLDPERFYINQSSAEQRKGNVYSWNRRFINPDPRFAKAMGVKPLHLTSVPKGEKLEEVGFALVPIATNNPTGGPEADQYNFKVEYDTGTAERGNIESVSEGILIKKTNPPDTKYTVVEDCKELTLK